MTARGRVTLWGRNASCSELSVIFQMTSGRMDLLAGLEVGVLGVAAEGCTMDREDRRGRPWRFFEGV